MKDYEEIIEKNFDNIQDLSIASASNELKETVNDVLNLLDKGEIRVCNKSEKGWVVNQWIKKAILLSFRLKDNYLQRGSYANWFDKVDSKTGNWSEKDFNKAGFRYVPNAVIRKSAFVAKNAVVMPSFINIGAYVDEGTMVDTWATVGSCAQIGKNVHLSGGVGIGGVLEPL